MKLGAVEWRPLALPATVVAAAVGVILWFNLVRVPAVEVYLHQAHLRVLRTVGAQIRTRIDGIQGNIDLALKTGQESKSGEDPYGKLVDDDNKFPFATFVRNYSPDLQIRCFTADQGPACSSEADLKLLKAANNPSVAQLKFDSGHWHLYVAYKASRAVVASIDLDKLFTENLPAERDFDVIFLADADGRVIVQYSPEKVDLARIDKLPIDPEGAAPPASAKDTDKEKGNPDAAVVSLRDVGPATRVLVGGRSYQPYVQQLPLPMQRWNAGTEQPEVMEEWTLGGLVATDRIRAASRAVSYDFIIWFGGLVLAMFAAIPLLKLRMLHPHERLTRRDAVLVGASIFIEVALVSLVFLDILQFGVRMPKIVDSQLSQVADDLVRGFTLEARAINRQLGSYDDELGKRLKGVAAIKKLPQIDVTTSICDPEWACRAVFSNKENTDIATMPYPFFDLVTWLDAEGNQRVKHATAVNVTPFINVRQQNLPYFEELTLARRLNDEVDDTNSVVKSHLGTSLNRSGISALVSPTTGKRLTVFWKALPVQRQGEKAVAAMVGQSLATNPLSFDQPPLPADVGFAVVNRDGLVLFHSDHTRSMKENFIQESENDLLLRTLIEHRQQGFLHVTYRAQDEQVLVRPLDFDTREQPAPFASPDWSLIVFQDHDLPDTLNLYTLVIAGSIFSGYTAVIIAALLFAAFFLRPRVLAWLWPDRRQTRAYWEITAINVALALACVFVTYRFDSPAALSVTLIAILTSLVVSYLRTHGREPGERSPQNRGRRALSQDWLKAFLMARASLIFVLAVVPALVSVRTATDLEQRIFMVREAREQQAGAQARLLALQSRVPIRGICSGKSIAECEADKVIAYEQRLQNAAAAGWFDPGPPPMVPPVPPLFRDQSGKGDPGTFWASSVVKRFLSAAHPPVNDIGVKLASVLDGVAPLYAVPSVTWLALLVLLAPLTFAMVRYAAKRMLVLDVSSGGAGLANDVAPLGTHRLLLTPYGSDTLPAWQGLSGARHMDLRLPLLADALLGRHPAAVVILHHFEVALVDNQMRRSVLRQLEAVVYRGRQTVWLVSTEEPVRFLERHINGIAKQGENGASNDRLEIDRWIRLLQSFRSEALQVGVVPESGSRTPLDADAEPAERAIADESLRCPAIAPLINTLRARLRGQRLTEADWWRALDDIAEPFYRSIWNSCSTEERLVLRQLVEEGLVNPSDQSILLSLMQKGLLLRDPAFRLMNVSFARFVSHAVPARIIAEWERQVAGTPWSSVRTALITFTVVGAGFVAFTQQELFGAWFGMALPALAPALFLPLLRDVLGKMVATRFTGVSASK